MRLRWQTRFIFLALFPKKSRFRWRRQTFRKVVIAEEELNRFDIDEIENLEGLPRFVFINDERGNLEVVNDDGEFTGDIKVNKSVYSKLYIPILQTVRNNVSMKNVIKGVKSIKLLN